MPCLLRLLLVSLLSCGVAFAQDTEKAEKYHRLLLKKPENPTVFDRFVEAWLDAGSKDDLQKWLEVKANSGDFADWRILTSFHDYLGEGGEAVAALDKAIKKDKRELESGIMIDQVVCLMDLNRKEEALKLGEKVKLDLLERLDRKKIITDLLEEKE
jgi:tetratricopeptide (TPR) repeat protein